ncbi:MAG: hypothetical protein AB8F95_06725 [Bacteroidia bacterium]
MLTKKRNWLTYTIVIIAIVGFTYITYSGLTAYKTDCEDSMNGRIKAITYNTQRDASVNIGGEWHGLMGFGIKEEDGFQIGDSLQKPHCSNTLVLYRKDTLNSGIYNTRYFYLNSDCGGCPRSRELL